LARGALARRLLHFGAAFLFDILDLDCDTIVAGIDPERR
jgi:hypothetical protein